MKEEKELIPLKWKGELISLQGKKQINHWGARCVYTSVNDGFLFFCELCPRYMRESRSNLQTYRCRGPTITTLK